MTFPRFLQITDLLSVPEPTLRLRLEAARGLSDVAVLVRDPQLSGRDLLAFAARTRALTRELGLGLFVTGRADVARVADADGVHLGRGSLPVDIVRALVPGSVITASCHGLDEIEGRLGEPASMRPDALVLSPIFASPGKPMPLGLGVLADAASRCQRAGVPLVALGGVDASNAHEAFAHGADAVAAIRADVVAMRASLR